MGPSCNSYSPKYHSDPRPMQERVLGKLKSRSSSSFPTHPPGWNSEGRSSQKLQLQGQLQVLPKEGSLSIWTTSYLGEIWTCNYHALTHLHLSHSCLSYCLLPLPCFIIPCSFQCPLSLNLSFYLVFSSKVSPLSLTVPPAWGLLPLQGSCLWCQIHSGVCLSCLFRVDAFLQQAAAVILPGLPSRLMLMYSHSPLLTHK